MKILHVISSLDKGGAETHLAMLSKFQSKKNLVKIIYLKGNGYWAKKLIKYGISIDFVNYKKIYNFLNFVCAYIKIKNIIKNFQPDVVHGHLSSSELLLSLIKFFNKRLFKLLITKHLDSFFLEGSGGKDRFFKGIFIDRFIFKNSNHLIFISNHTKKFFLKKIPSANKKISLIYYGFDQTFYKNSNRNKINLIKKKILKKNHIILSNISRHVKQKSLHILLKTIAYLKFKHNLKPKLLLVGNGPENNNLKLLARRLKINNLIVWFKYYENVKDIFDISDFFILTSEYEGLGLVLLEAMNSRTPILVRKTSSLPEIVKNNMNGYLIKSADPSKFAQKINFLINNREQIKKIKLNSRKVLLKNFNYLKMCKQTENVYKKNLR